MKLIGKGANGKAYKEGNKVIKITKSKKEFEFALWVLENNPFWFCKIYSAKKLANNKYEIVKEYVDAFEDMGYSDSITLSSEFLHFNTSYLIFAWCRKGLHISFLRENVQNIKSKDGKRLAEFIILNFDSIIKSNIDKCDIWCNVGYNQKGDIVIFDGDFN